MLGKIFIEQWLSIQREPISTLEAAHSNSHNKILIIKRQLKDPFNATEEEIATTLTRFINFSIANSQNQLPIVTAKLSCMLLIDELFSAIHPRAPKFFGAAAPNHPNWLKKYHHNRSTAGFLDQTEDATLIFKGPLNRNAPSEANDNAFTLRNSFYCLSIAPKEFGERHETAIKIEQRYFAKSLFTTSGTPNHANNRLTIIPLAINNGDIISQTVCTTKSKKITRTRYQLNPNIDAANEIHSILKIQPPKKTSDICISPEFAVDERAAQNLSRKLSNDPSHASLIVAGSGNSMSVCETTNNPWNISYAMSGTGLLYWTQRKIWHASIHAHKAATLGIDKYNETEKIYEANATSNSISVCDLDNIGRCITLICQDILLPHVPSIIRTFQPDWVFILLLDSGIQEKRWSAIRAINLSAESQANLVVCSSVEYAKKENKPENCCMTLTPAFNHSDSSLSGKVCYHGLTSTKWTSIDWPDIEWTDAIVSSQ